MGRLPNAFYRKHAISKWAAKHTRKGNHEQEDMDT